MNKKVIISIIVVVILIILIVAFMIYKNSQAAKEQEAQRQYMLIQQQLSQPNIPVNQKQVLLGQLANLAAVLASKAKPGSSTPPPVNTSTSAPINQTVSAPNTPAPASFPLKNGSTGPFVQEAQKAINAKCGYSLVTDGKFGPKSESAALSCLGAKTISWPMYQNLIGLYGS